MEPAFTKQKTCGRKQIDSQHEFEPPTRVYGEFAEIASGKEVWQYWTEAGRWSTQQEYDLRSS